MATAAIRQLMFLAAGLALSACAPTGSPTTAAPTWSGIPAGHGLAELAAGNARFLRGDVQTHDWLHERIHVTGSEGQSPSVGVLTCSDSRTPPELIFDRGIGELFVVRLAGFVQSDIALGTFEYGVSALGLHTIVVLGHTKCGAVSATVAGYELPGHMPEFVASIKPAIAGLPRGADGKVSAADAEIANVRWQAKELLAKSEILAKAKADGRLDILRAIYDVETGEVRFLTP